LPGHRDLIEAALPGLLSRGDRQVSIDGDHRPMNATCDVFVVGGGPGGSTVATLLSEKGWTVVLAEQDRHPRFHIGESLLPMNMPIFRRLGLLDAVHAIGVVKEGVEFSPAGAGDRRQTFYFSDALDKTNPYAFHVRRSEFDELLFRNATARGVTTFEGLRVKAIDFAAGDGGRHSVVAVDEGGAERRWQARFVVDASGRDTFLPRRLEIKEKNREHQSAAIFGHFRGVERRPGKDAGNISIYWFDYGWFWVIPLRDDVTSVGAVCWPDYLKSRDAGIEEFLWRTIRLCPEVAARMRQAEPVDKARATGNYSYRSHRMYGDGYILVGDAFAFIDPVFSTGVYLAMTSAIAGSEAVDTVLRRPEAAPAALARFEREVRRGLDRISWFIYRFTAPAMRELFMAPRDVMRMRQSVLSMLAGDVFRDTPIRLPLFLFKALFYVHSIAALPAAWASRRQRRRNVAVAFPDDASAAGGTSRA
jgi:flavin-dependent dehydrogenase